MSDFTALSRSDWLELADRLYVRIDRACAAFTTAEWNRVTPYLGWRVRDVLAHMTSAMPVNFRQVLDRALAGDASPPAEFDTFRRNAREVARRRAQSVDHLLEEFRSELSSILAIYRGMSEEEWLKPAWFFVGPVRVRTLFLVQLADNAFHERDLLVVNGRWNGLDPAWAEPLVDWFMREYRPASFRPDRAAGLSAAVQYRLDGAGGGEWTMTLEGGVCSTARGATRRPDVVVEAAVEDLMAAALARAAPGVGALARRIDGIGGRSRSETVVAAITGTASLVSAMLRKRIRISGDRATALRVQRAFWHFWQRPRQTQENIARGLRR